MIRSLVLPLAPLVLAGSVALAHPPHHNAPKAQPAPAPQQPAEVPGPAGRNLQVLPGDIPQERLMLIMSSWNQALGVQCSYCHVPSNPRSDANPHKDARGMLQMTMQINKELLPAINGLHGGAVTCYTCHRGMAQPALAATEEWPGPGAQPQPQPQPHHQPEPEPESEPRPLPPQAPPRRRKPGDAPPAHIAPDTPARPY